MEVMHRTDYATAALVVRKRIDVPLKKSAVAMSDQFQFDFARYERLIAKSLEYDR